MKAATVHRFRLYVAGDAENSRAALVNLRAICEKFLPGAHQIELVDVLVEPLRALADGAVMTPMLIKLTPLPARKIIGSLTDLDRVLSVLELPAMSE